MYDMLSCVSYCKTYHIKQKFRGLQLCLYDAAARNYTTINTTKLIRRYHEIQRKYFDTYTTQSQDTTTML